jgi:predicted acetyltransferase
MGQFFGGRAVPTLGIAGVGIEPERRRLGAATALMSKTLQTACEAGVALSTLYASTAALYRKVGYGVAGARYQGEVPMARVKGAVGDLSVRRLDESDRAAMGALYTTTARHRPGHLARGPYVWDRIFRAWKDRPPICTGVFDDDRMVGYIVWRQSVPDPNYTIRIADQVAPTFPVARRIWAFLADQGTVVDAVHGATAPDDPFWLSLPWPGPEVKLHHHWMLRLVDLPAAISERGFASEQLLVTDLRIEDPVIARNTGHWRLIVEDGRGRLEPGGSGSVRITIDGLAALYSGFQCCNQLAARGVLDGGGDQWPILDAMFRGSAPWMPDFF